MPLIDTNGIQLEYEVLMPHGRATGLPMLLIMGLGMQMTDWPDPLIDRLRAAGHPVLRFDNRDIGLSTKDRAWGKPDLMTAGLMYTMGLQVQAPYTLDDMARDTVGLLDAIGLAQVHVVGVSMGGMIGQVLAIDHRERVASFTCIMSSSGSRLLPGPRPAARMAMVSRPRNPRDFESIVEHGVRLLGVLGSPGHPTPHAQLRARVAASVRRSHHPIGMLRQLVAVSASGDRSRGLKTIATPTTIVHGKDDPLVPVAAAHDLARKIPGAQLRLFDGMGHDLPEALLPRIADAVLETAARGEADH